MATPSTVAQDEPAIQDGSFEDETPNAAPSFSVDPGMLSFTVDTGTVSDAETLTLTNDGDTEGTYSIATVILPAPRATADAPVRHRGTASKALRGLMPPTEGTPWRGGEIVADGSFEGGTPNGSWGEASSNFGTPLCTSAVCAPNNADFQPRTGTWWAWFGGAEAAETGSIDQDVTIPNGTATLAFWLRIPVGDSPGTFDVLMDSDVVFSATEADTMSFRDYTEVVVDISSFADGQSHTLRFESTQDGSAATVTNFFVDDVTITTEASNDPIVLSVDPDAGTVDAASSQEISVTVDATDAEPGTYQAQLVITTDDEDNPEIVVAVDITVNPPVSNEDGRLAAGFVLRPSYPNPFAAQTTLSYDLAEAATVRVEVYDVTGRRVATLVDTPQAAGTHEVEWDAAGLPSGVYIYQVEAGRFRQTQRITLVR
ncbi:MAG: T9SS type A sorting domain-containing protein [Bacteroidota bacterium]